MESACRFVRVGREDRQSTPFLASAILPAETRAAAWASFELGVGRRGRGELAELVGRRRSVALIEHGRGGLDRLYTLLARARLLRLEPCRPRRLGPPAQDASRRTRGSPAERIAAIASRGLREELFLGYSERASGRIFMAFSPQSAFEARAIDTTPGRFIIQGCIRHCYRL